MGCPNLRILPPSPSAKRRYRRRLRQIGREILLEVQNPIPVMVINKDTILAYRSVEVSSLCKAVPLHALECAGIPAPATDLTYTVTDSKDFAAVAMAALSAPHALDQHQGVQTTLQEFSNEFAGAALDYFGWSHCSGTVGHSVLDYLATVGSDAPWSGERQDTYQVHGIPASQLERQCVAVRAIQRVWRLHQARLEASRTALPDSVDDHFADVDFCREIVTSFWEDLWEHCRGTDRHTIAEARCLLSNLHPNKFDDLPLEAKAREIIRCKVFARRINRNLFQEIIHDYEDIVVNRNDEGTVGLNSLETKLHISDFDSMD